MKYPLLILNGVSYSLSEIRQGNFVTDNPFEISTLNFIRDWLNEKQEFVLTTSGSTGMPKIISINRKQLLASAHLTVSYLGLKKEYSALVCLDTRYIAGIMMLVRAMEVGMTMYVEEPSANPFAKIPQHVPIDFVALVPYQLQAILQSEAKERFNTVKIALIGGARLPEKTRNDLDELSCSFYSTYGMTETFSHIALQRLNGAEAQNSFQVLPGISVRKDERGCLVIEAATLGIEPVITNDLVEIVAPDQFIWLGRIDTVINSGGIKVIPEKLESDIEKIMNALGLPNRFFIAGLPDALLGQVVTLIIEGESLISNDEQRLQHQLRQTLSRYEVPKAIRYITHFIVTDTGKINKPKTLGLLR